MTTNGITIETLDPKSAEPQTLSTIKHTAFTADHRDWDGKTRRVMFVKCETENLWFIFSPHYRAHQYVSGSIEVTDPRPVTIEHVIVREER